MLAYQLIACREVDNDVGATQRRISAGRNGNPQVFTHLNGNAGIAHRENQVVAKLALFGCRTSATEPALLVKFFIVREIGLRNITFNVTIMDKDGAVEEFVAAHHWCSHHNSHIGAAGFVANPAECIFGLMEQSAVVEQVAAGIAGYREFGKDDKINALLMSLAYHLENVFQVEVHVGNVHARHSRRHPQVAISSLCFITIVHKNT